MAAVKHVPSDGSDIVKHTSSKRQAAWRMRRLVGVTFLHVLVDHAFFHDLGGAFIRSTVSCEAPVPSASHECPRGSTYADGTSTCEAQPPESAMWSLSDRCVSKDVVINQGKDITGHLGMIKHIGMIVAVMFIGPMADTWGRKQVMLVALIGGAVRMALILAAAQVTDAEALILTGEFIFSTTNAYPVAAKAMATDLSPSDVQARSASFSALHIMFELAELLGFIAGYFVLKRHLANYTTVWAAVLLADVSICVLAGVTLKATKVPRADPCGYEGEAEASLNDSEPEERNYCLRTLLETVGVVRIIQKDAVLRQLCVLITFHAVGTTGLGMVGLFLISSLGWSQESASLTGVVIPLVAAIGSGVAPRLVNAFGGYFALAAAMSLSAAGLSLVGLCGPLAASPWTAGLIWSGAVLAGLGRGMFGGTFPAVVSIRVEAGMQGRLFAFINICEYVAWAVFVDVSHEYLFDAKWTGWRSGIVFFTAAGTLLVGAAWLAALSPDRGARSRGVATDSSSSSESTSSSSE